MKSEYKAIITRYLGVSTLKKNFHFIHIMKIKVIDILNTADQAFSKNLGLCCLLLKFSVLSILKRNFLENFALVFLCKKNPFILWDF